MNARRLIAIVAALAALNLVGAAAGGLEFGLDRWPKGTRVLTVYDRVPAAADPALRRAVRQWNAAGPGPRLRVVAQRPGPRPCAAARGALVVCQADPGDGYPGLGSLAYDRDGFVKAGVVRMAPGELAPFLWCHELGHMLGLQHADEPGELARAGCMAERWDRSGPPEAPGPWERQQLRRLYR